MQFTEKQSVGSTVSPNTLFRNYNSSLFVLAIFYRRPLQTYTVCSNFPAFQPWLLFNFSQTYQHEITLFTILQKNNKLHFHFAG